MLTGIMVGTATSTAKHDSLNGWKLALVQAQMQDGSPDGEPVLAIDNLGAAMGSRVVLTSEGGAVRDMLKRNDSPVRWMVMGLCDS
ncbi:MAG: ethanolamine utilization protein EutN [Gemmataceae bacterium]|nr:ethanolamine utilization protein EutN [Gemmataceae bacterium]